MNKPVLLCDNRERRKLVRRRGRNGLDYLEVSDDHLRLTVYFLDKVPANLTAANVRITGGRRIRGLQVVDVHVCRLVDEERDDCLVVFVDRAGDFSSYRLCIVEVVDGEPTDQPHPDMDPRYACLDFTFAAGCRTDLDCALPPICPPPERQQPDINYLAKDYASFRQLILDRLALLMPDWRERRPPDIGIALVELLAYVGDHLSYYQDAVATEAYLDTARERISVRRHARLVDYVMHEGNNARAWVFVRTDGNPPPLLPDQFFFITREPRQGSTGKVLEAAELPRDGRFLVFEPLVDNPGAAVQFHPAHNQIPIYAWGDRECCLPRGTTRVALVDGMATYEAAEPVDPKAQRGPRARGSKPEPEPEQVLVWNRVLNLQAGDFLLLEQVRGPRTGSPSDADPAHRHVVRLTRVWENTDTLPDPPVPLLEVEWDAADALPFPFCLSAVVPELDCQYLDGISVARGNLLLVDHGQTVWDELPMPPADVDEQVTCDDEGRPVASRRQRVAPNPVLARGPLTFAQPLPRGEPAARLLSQAPRKALPQVWLTGDPDAAGNARWLARPDLLASGPSDMHFVVEVDEDRVAHLRFGSDDLGRRPTPGAAFNTRYRVGNGPAGNVGSHAIAHVVLRGMHLDGVSLLPRNPFPAQGGVAPEPVSEVKLFAPFAFRQELQRAITASDYARLAERDSSAVQRAAARLRWTGSWYEVLVAVDPLGAGEADQALLDQIRAHLELYRRIGHDVQVASARRVPLSLKMEICVREGYLRGHVKAALLDLLSSRRLPDGGAGFFHPDNLSFGEGVMISKLVALAHSVPGVENAIVRRLERYFEPSTVALEEGVLRLDLFEIAQLDNDPSSPESGVLELEMLGGR